MNGLKWEKNYPTIISLIVLTPLIYFTKDDFHLNSTILMTILIFSIISIGILIDMQLIWLSMKDTKTSKRLKTSPNNHYLIITQYLKSATYFNFLLMLASLFIIALDPKDDFAYYTGLLWIWILLISAMTSYRIIRIFMKFLSCD